MISESLKRTLPASPVTLSFNKEEFMKEDFNVDLFVVECRRRVPLETLRNDLSVYLKILQSAMIELINKDYADFVNLSTNLVGVDKAINNLTTPLGQLRDEVMKVREAMDQAIVAVEGKMEYQSTVKDRKACLQRLIAITQSVDKMEKLLGIQRTDGERLLHPGQYASEDLTGQLIERVATEFNKLQFYVNKSRGAPLVEHIKPRITNITNTLQISLETQFSEGLETNNAHVLRQCLRTYATIDKMRDAESLFRQQVVRPYMEAIVTEQYISQNPQGLKGMYQKIVDFIPKHCSTLRDALTKGTEVVRGYDFIVNAVWPEIVVNIEAKTPSIFAPGNPNIFHERFCMSVEFVRQLELQCGSQTSVRRLRAHPSYATFLARWSLPVYFQIRFQEIAGSLEAVLEEPFSAASAGSRFRLAVTDVLWGCVGRCWGSDVYLSPLCHRFWKLTLQLVSRYTTWVHGVLKVQLKPSRSGAEGDSGTRQPDTDPAPTQPHASRVQIVLLVADCRAFAAQVPALYMADIEPHMAQIGLTDTSILTDSLSAACETLLQTEAQFAAGMEEELTAQCCVHLKLVSDTPRLYRRTNREVPTRPSGYVTNLLKPLLAFLHEHRAVLTDTGVRPIVTGTLHTLTEQYYQTTSDVLTAVRKMEESLKRLKKGKGKSGGGVAGPSDDDKIRLQLLLDVSGYGQQIELTGVLPAEIASYSKLRQLVQSASNATS